jgi:phosphatidylglycerol lysyltransferase
MTEAVENRTAMAGTTNMTEFAGSAAVLDAKMREKLLLPVITSSAHQGTSLAALRDVGQVYVGRGVPGFVPFVRSNDLCLGLGAPLANRSAVVALATEFVDFIRHQGMIPGFFPASGPFLAAISALGLRGVRAAVEPVRFLDGFSVAAPSGKRLRHAIRQAEHKGVHARLKFGIQLDDAERIALQEIESEWLSRKASGGAQFLFAAEPWRAAAIKRYAVAYVDEEPCAFASLAPMPGRNGWMVEGLFRKAGIPAGTSEFLLARTMEEFRDEGFSVVSLGPSILAVGRRGSDYDVELETVSEQANGVLRWLYAHAPGLLNYRSAHRFKLKFRPDRVEPLFFAFDGDQPDAEMLHNFLSIVFQEFDFGGLVQELWDRLASKTDARMLLSRNEED